MRVPVPRKPCPNNCPDETCKVCRERAYAREYARRRKIAFPDKVREEAQRSEKAWRAKHPKVLSEAEKARRRAQYQARKHGPDAEAWRRLGRSANLKANTGATLEQFEAILAAQASKCAVCDAHLDAEGKNYRAPIMDHCHVAGKPRGVLCYGCNTKLGAIESPLYGKLLDYKQHWDSVLHGKT